MKTSLFLLAALQMLCSSCQALDGDVVLVTFDGASGTTHKFSELNDPVMGGKSTGTWSVDSGHGVFDGEVVDVPSLSAPGFIASSADGKFPDASSSTEGDVVLMVRSTTPEYTGFRFSFASGTVSPQYSCAGGGGIPFSRGCFKNNFTVPEGDEFSEVLIPVQSFSDKWSSATGDQTKQCEYDKDVCPTDKTLKSIQRVEFWAEGHLGKIHLEVQSVAFRPAATTSSSLRGSSTSSPSEKVDESYQTCSVQAKLKYNLSSRTTPETLSPYVDANETLAGAVCCDKRTIVLAEPQFTYLAPDIDMFGKIEKSGGQKKVTTFYDSACGIPLFKAPMNRSYADFKADTSEHGWPSFRPDEVVAGNVLVDETTGIVTSKCGTHLGSYLPDDQGPRWCMDLSCISGNPSV